MEIPPEYFEGPLDEAWCAVDAMWRVELIGNPELLRQWREARRKVAYLRERLRDLLRYQAYEARSKSDNKKQETAKALRPQKQKARKAAQIRHSRRS